MNSSQTVNTLNDKTDNNGIKMKNNRSKQSISRIQMEIIWLQTMSLQLLLLSSNPYMLQWKWIQQLQLKNKDTKMLCTTTLIYILTDSHLLYYLYILQMAQLVNTVGEHYSRPSRQQDGEFISISNNTQWRPWSHYVLRLVYSWAAREIWRSTGAF